MDNETKELLTKVLSEISIIKEKVETIEKNQIQVANAEHKNWHMLADKLQEYDKVLHSIFGKQNNELKK